MCGVCVVNICGGGWGGSVTLIYLAKAWRTPRDSTSAQLAAQYGITMKAVRDIWNQRTWPWVTMPYSFIRKRCL